MLRPSNITRSNSEYSLQDLARPRSRLRHSQSCSRNESEDESHPRNSNGETRTAVPQGVVPTHIKTGTSLGKFWKDYVSCEVDLSASRDHLANERTFLGYLRTSVMMSMVGTMVAQLFTLSHEGHHAKTFGYFITGKPLALTCYGFSIGTILLGAVRTWRHQRIMMSGKALVGGFEIHVLGICSMTLLLVFFSFLLSIDIVKDGAPMTTTL
ncbi:hypothetical protein FPSE_03970 [Fusarium pseudograminearum CS3096]|uniref:DUF202 domain-containing protein n=1 Tax=Fusarium pseudograminearum (strain CS3096) TaxID=1028729 RepID=K3W1F1_FUSPC|nr:hypothetical protein FPSE_03970 [Fusarium pseudograminearum CS3096]EKJ75790.1 hypothetical protein FPSE_03970 [Fusarium pseudograminearum CS3096]